MVTALKSPSFQPPAEDGQAGVVEVDLRRSQGTVTTKTKLATRTNGETEKPIVGMSSCSLTVLLCNAGGLWSDNMSLGNIFFLHN